MAKTLGIIGGMGPAATLDLVGKIYAQPVESEQQQLRVLADIDPTIPDRTQEIMAGRTERIVPHLLKNAQGLENQGAELLAMACNTAHAFVPYFQQQLSVPFVNMIESTVEYIVELNSGPVGLMATDGTLAAGLYVRQLRQRGIDVIVPHPRQQTQVMNAIYGYKVGEVEKSRAEALAVFSELMGQGAVSVIAGCTELPILLAGQQSVVDPTAILAASLIKMAQDG